MARCASLSFARFLASCSGVKLATPREVAGPVLRFLLTGPGDDGAVSSGGEVVVESICRGGDICDIGSESASAASYGQARCLKESYPESWDAHEVLGALDADSHA
jgi:hypothetical protein